MPSAKKQEPWKWKRVVLEFPPDVSKPIHRCELHAVGFISPQSSCGNEEQAVTGYEEYGQRRAHEHLDEAG